MSFEFVPPEQFFRILYKDANFCEGMGKVMLSASLLETNIRKYLKVKDVKGVRPKSTLGNLVQKLRENDLLSKNGQIHFDDLTLKRNYLAHSLYDLFTKEINETILERDELTAMDTDIFVRRAHQLAEDFLYFANIVSEANTNTEKLL